MLSLLWLYEFDARASIICLVSFFFFSFLWCIQQDSNLSIFFYSQLLQINIFGIPWFAISLKIRVFTHQKKGSLLYRIRKKKMKILVIFGNYKDISIVILFGENIYEKEKRKNQNNIVVNKFIEVGSLSGHILV